MGKMSRQNSTVSSPPPNEVRESGETQQHSQTSTKNSLDSSSSENSSSPPASPQPTNEIIPAINAWALPLESLVLKNQDIDLPLNFLKIYYSILWTFGGSPCDALGRAITYFQSLFTESPAFHPYVMHLPFGRVPRTEAEGLIVAAALEKELIRVVQHLLAFFYSDVEAVLRYINDCPAELIPRPHFVIAEERPLPNNGVEGYNNKHPGGLKLWQNPISTSVWRLQRENDALRLNISRCADWIERKKSPPLPNPNRCPPQRFPQRPLPPPPPPQPRVTGNIAPPLPPPMQIQPVPPMPPMHNPIQPQQTQLQIQPFAMQPPVIQNMPPPPPPAPPPTRPPIIFPPTPLPQPAQDPATQAPQPSAIPFIQTARPAVAMPHVRPPQPPATSSLKDDISRIEAQMTRLLDLVSKGQSGA